MSFCSFSWFYFKISVTILLVEFRSSGKYYIDINVFLKLFLFKIENKWVNVFFPIFDAYFNYSKG